MKQSQIVAIEESLKKKKYADLTEAHHILQKADQFTGMQRVYTPKNDDGIEYPAEKKLIQQDARKLVQEIKTQLSEFYDIVATKDFGNCDAKADIVVDGKTLATQVPITFILTFGQKLTDLRTLINKLPVLDPSKEWSHDPATGQFKTQPEKKIKTRKVKKPLVKAEATQYHPAQVDVIDVEEQEGTYTEHHYSTAYTVDEVKTLLSRLEALEKAVKIAKEEANSVQVSKVDVGSIFMKYIFG